MGTDNKQLMSEAQYCARCCMPSTSEGTIFDELGICRACQSSEQKMHINWKERGIKLKEVLDEFKAKSGDNYDCLVPISGGKDSAFQLHVLVKVFGMKPLAVTFSHNWFTEVGNYNLWNILEKLNVDHLMFTPNRGLISKIARQSLYNIGDSCWHCHAGIGAFPLQAAIKFKIPLIIWGESIAEAGNKVSYMDNGGEPIPFDENYYLKVSSKVSPEKMVTEDLTMKDLYPFKLPEKEEVKNANIFGIHLGDYMFWDGERQTEFIKKEYDWKEDDVEGTYKRYKSVECKMPGVHDYSKFVKRGFGRTTDHVSQDVRNGLMTREEAFELVREIEPKRPDTLDDYLEITQFSEKEFYDILKSHREPDVNFDEIDELIEPKK
jgi:N-acetyl sugar amidotransferase